MGYFLSVCLGIVAGALLGGLIGYVVDLVTGNQGWTLALGGLLACLGALWAGLRRAEGRYIWRVRQPSKVEAAAPPAAEE